MRRSIEIQWHDTQWQCAIRKREPMAQSRPRWFCAAVMSALLLHGSAQAQTLINVDFGVGAKSAKVGLAATGQSTNDFWNLYRHYEPKFTPGMALVSEGALKGLKQADGGATAVSISVSNAPGVWGNASGDAMYDSYIFSQNGSNITVAVRDLEPGRYHFFLYGHADADVAGEQNSVFHMRSGTNVLGPLIQTPESKVRNLRYVVARDVPVTAGEPVMIEVAAGANGVPVLNGMQIVSRGTGPPHFPVGAAPKHVSTHTNVLFREVRYTGENIGDTEARFAVELLVYSMATNEVSSVLFEGDVAVSAPSLPKGVRIVSSTKKYHVVVSAPGEYRLSLAVVARIQRSDAWNRISFMGPDAAVASVSARPHTAGVEMQLLSGTPLNGGGGEVKGLIGADRVVALRWQSKTSEVARKSLVTVDTRGTAQVSPTVIKYQTEFRYEILQAPVPKLTMELPASHTLTRLQGEQIKDWAVKSEGGRQVLTVELIKPVEKQYGLTVLSEQSIAQGQTTAELSLPQPVNVTRESGSLNITADGAVVELESAAGLRQVNAPAGTLAAYRFHGRPIGLSARVRPVEPVVKVTDRVTARLEEARLLVRHAVTLAVEKAGVYSVEMTPQTGFTVTAVQGEGVEDWSVAEGKLKISFASRVLGKRRIDVQLEQGAYPAQVVIAAMAVTGAASQKAEIGVAPAPGISVKTAAGMQGVREIPVSSLSERSDELLAFSGEGVDWRVALTMERLPARIVAEVFNLITIGDGLVGGSATIRYGLINQGVQTFQVKLPAHWKNVDFIGPNIRRKDAVANAADTNHIVWSIVLQDKAWGGYTLVVTYDYPFDPQKASLDLRGAHAIGAERETGSMAVTTAASLKLRPATATEPLRVIDQTELADTDRALINRPVLLAYRYAGADYRLTLDVTRHEEVRMLEAVADRTQITSVLTEGGEMLTQASFMVKNNDKQFQRFLLPTRAEFWGCYVNNQPSKAERDGDWLLISLPRTANRDEAFAVELVYAQKFDSLKGRVFANTVQFAAPRSDVPNTFAEWQVYAPKTLKLTRFSGSMSVLRGTTYGLKDGWGRFVDYYAMLWRERGAGILLFGGAFLFIVSVIVAAARSGKHGLVTVVVVFAIAAVMAGMLLPALSKAKARAQRISAVSNLKQIALAARMYANDHGGKFPNNFEEMMAELNTDKILRDPQTGERFVYVGAGKTEETLGAILCYSPVDQNGRVVAFADGSVAQMSSEQFAEALRKDASGLAAQDLAQGPRSMALNGAPAAQGLAAATPPLLVAQPAPVGPAIPTVTGLRSIRIELPRSGQPYTFTKVLNVRHEPLTIGISGMSHKWYNARRSAMQLAAFVAGLLMLWVQLRRAQRSTLALAIAVTLVIGSLASLLIAARVLHTALIVGVPLIAAGFLIQVIRKLWPRRAADAAETSLINGTSPSTPGPAVAAIALGLFFAPAFGVMAQEKTNAVSVVSAAYSGAVKDKVAQFTATLQVTTVAAEQRVPLFAEDVAVQDFTSKGMQLVRDGRGVSLQVKESGTHEAQMRFAVKLGGDVSKQQLSFGIPAALSSELALTIEEPDADVEFSSAVAFKRVAEGNATRVEGIVGAGDRVELAWTPRVKRVAEMEASVFAQTTTIVTAGAGVVNTRALIDYHVSQGELRRLRVRLPAGRRLLRVEGEKIRTWELAEDDVLTVELLKGAATSYKLTVETERTVESLPATIKVEVPAVLGVIRQSGAIALRPVDEVTLAVESADELARIDAAELESALKIDGVTAAFRHLKPEFNLQARAELVRPQIDAVVRNSIRLEFEQTRISARVAYSIRKAGVFGVRLGLPEGFKVESVTAGSNILQWVEKTNPALIDVTLKQRTMGDLLVNVELTRAHAEVPTRIEAVGVHPLDASKVTGYVSAASEAGLGVKAATIEGLTEIPAAELGEKTDSTAAILAYKYVTSQAAAVGPWKLTLATETIDSWVRAEIVHSYAISETMVSGKALVRYEVQNAPVKEFRVRIPAGFTNVEVFGANIRRRDPAAEYRVELQTKVRGTYTLTVTWEQARVAGTNIALQTIQALGVERETGAIVVLAKPPLQVTEQTVSEQLIKADVRELPDWAGVAAGASSGSEAAVLVYQYSRPGPSLTVQANRFSDAAVLQALADNARLTTVVADDGQAMTEMTLSIRNNGKQHLEIELPAGATPWSAFVAGQPVRPKKIGNKLLLPLDASSGSETPVSVEITFMGNFQFPRRKGDVTMESPKMDVPIKNARWEVYLPLDYEYSEFGGSMGHEREMVPVSQMFSLSEYARQEQDKKAARKSELRGYVSNVRRGLSEGNVKVAVEEFNQADRLAATDAEAQQELVDLKKELGRVQSSNLIQAQKNYTLENAERFGVQVQERAGQKGADSVTKFEADAAEQQWKALQRAQAVSATRVQPLRVNLPTRGLRHSFTQVLQTEVQKPLTIKFEARNTSSVGWFKRVAYSIGGFVVLWIFVSVLDNRRRQRNELAAEVAAA